MDISAVRALAHTVAWDTYGVDATVTPLNGDPIETTAVWLPPLQEDMPIGHDFQRRDPRRILALRRTVVSTLPRGSEIVAPEYRGSAARTWKVDGIDGMDAEQIRAIVTPVSG